jgi:GAF domain-containing protein
VLPVLSAAVLIGSTGEAPSPVQKLLSTRLMVGLGLISYPLYLWHWPLLSYARIIENGTPSVSVRLELLALAVALSVATYKLVEQPVRRLPRRWAIGGLVALMTLVALVGANIYTRDGLERIRHKRIIHMDEVAAADFVDFEKVGLITEDRCDQPFKFPERDVCLAAAPDKAVTAVVVGDSHAVHAFWGLAEALKATGDNLKVLGKGACVPFLHYSQGGDAVHCQPHIDNTLTSIVANPSVRKVMLVFRGRYLPADAGTADIQAFEQGLDATLQLLNKAGKQVYYFLPVAEPGFDPRLCVGSLPMGRKPPQACVIDHALSDQKSVVIREVAQRVTAKYPRVVLVDPNTVLCPDASCPLIQEGHSLFKDDNHLSQFGSLRVGRGLNLDARQLRW